jgi:hypothetical protein
VTQEDIAGMLRRDREEWNKLVATLDAHPGGPVHDPESPDWEARHVYAHLARWLTKSMDDFEAVLEGRAPPDPPDGVDDVINARWREGDAAVDFSAAREQAHQAYERRVELIERAPADRWSNPLKAIAYADGYQHYASHRRYIESAGLHQA